MPDPFATAPIDTRPHSRACGGGFSGTSHSHGRSCMKDCPTCHGDPTKLPRDWAHDHRTVIVDWDGWTSTGFWGDPQHPELPVTHAEFERRLQVCTVSPIPAEPTAPKSPADALPGGWAHADGRVCYPDGHGWIPRDGFPSVCTRNHGVAGQTDLEVNPEDIPPPTAQRGETHNVVIKAIHDAACPIRTPHGDGCMAMIPPAPGGYPVWPDDLARAAVAALTAAGWLRATAAGVDDGIPPTTLDPTATVHYGLRPDLHNDGEGMVLIDVLHGVTCEDCLTWASETLQQHLEDHKVPAALTVAINGDKQPANGDQRPLDRSDLAGFLPRPVVDTGRCLLGIRRGHTDELQIWAEGDYEAQKWAAAGNRYLLGPLDIPEAVQVRYAINVPATTALHTAIADTKDYD